MKRCFALAVLLVTLSGCKMKEFSSTPFYTGDEVKYSGRVEDRITLWPLDALWARVGWFRTIAAHYAPFYIRQIA